jgi:hypothetical protein
VRRRRDSEVSRRVTVKKCSYLAACLLSAAINRPMHKPPVYMHPFILPNPPAQNHQGIRSLLLSAPAQSPSNPPSQAHMAPR